MRIDSGTNPNIELRLISRRPASQRQHPTRRHDRAKAAGGRSKHMAGISDAGYAKIQNLTSGHSGFTFGPQLPLSRLGKRWQSMFANLFGGGE